MAAKRGPKHNPELVRYNTAANVGSALYLIEAGEMIKIGRSVMPACRLRTLHTQLGGLGHVIGRFQIFPGPRDSCGVEAKCIRELSAIATARRSAKSEYFFGISFDHAVSVVKAVLKTNSKA